MFDKNRNTYVETVTGLGMHVVITDPEQKIVLSKVIFLFFSLYTNREVQSIKIR